jgi:DNA polymerase-4
MPPAGSHGGSPYGRHQMQPLMLHSWPRGIAHVDADAFFASVEQAIHPEYKGKPVITGAERGIVAAASYEAKALGIKRAIPLGEVKKIAPHCIILPSDYETYSLFSERMFAILRRFSPQVEEHSIDEAFVELTGLRRLHHAGYPRIAQCIQETVAQELGITVSVGVSLSKSLTKLCSKRDKPNGLTVVPGRKIHLLLQETALKEVWGFGPNTTAFLEKNGLRTAWDYVQLPLGFIKKRLGKVGVEIYRELRGESVYPINAKPKTTYASISKFKTFAPATRDPAIIYARLLRNLESACLKARRYKLQARRLICILRGQDFSGNAHKAILSRPSAYPTELQHVLRKLFVRCHEPARLYRATGIVLTHLTENVGKQFDLFSDPLRIVETVRLYESIDEINARHGKHTVFLGDGIPIQGAHSGRRGDTPARKKTLLKGETDRQRLGIPMLYHRV